MSGITEQPYYNRGKIKVGVFIRDQKLCFDKGNVIKYVCRAGFKPGVSEVSDLRKAIDSLLMLIQHIEEEAAEMETVTLSSLRGVMPLSKDSDDEKPTAAREILYDHLRQRWEREYANKEKQS